MKRAIALAIAAFIVAAMPGLASAGKSKNVWEDPAGDADNAQGLGQSIPAGFDLTGGSIARNKDNLEFTVSQADMPPSGSPQETFRFMWAFSVGTEYYRLTAKTADVGKPDVLAGQTDDRVGEVDAMGHFRLEGNCQAGETVGTLQPINCEQLAKLEGSFNASDTTITIIVPLEAIGAKTGSKIGPGAGDAIAICSICWASHAAERSHSDTIIDSAFQTGVYKVTKS